MSVLKLRSKLYSPASLIPLSSKACYLTIENDQNQINQLTVSLFFMIKIVQITDLHIGHEGQATMGVDVRQNFQDLVQVIRNLSPDLIVVTGDICYDVGEAPIYQWVRSHLDYLQIPYTAIAGNHDDPMMLAKEFAIDHQMDDGQLFFKRKIAGRTVLFLGTAKGEVACTQLDWLKNELSQIDEDTIVFMHHPPITGGVPFMDGKHALRNMPELQEVLFNFGHHLTVFCGHYHVEKTIHLKNLTVHITPSAYFQIDWKEQGFKVDHHRIGLREIILRDDGAVENTVIYQEGNKAV